ncbi:MAG: hypothetical protein MJZ20_05765 [Bacteroidaceae bacterium]|nr:hypothetical protein [Bacteroidaceae bacterium]
MSLPIIDTLEPLGDFPAVKSKDVSVSDSKRLNDVLEDHEERIAELEAGGGGGEGAKNYNDLVNKPLINNVPLSGNLNTEEIGIHIPTKISELQNDIAVPERKIKATLWPNNLSEEEFYAQLDRLIDDGFTDFILPIHLAYDDTLNLYVSTTNDYEEIIRYVEEHGCRIYCLKFHMRAVEFNKKDNSISIVEYREKVAEIVNKYADRIEMCTVFNEIHSIVKSNKTAIRDTVIRLKSTGVKVAITFSHYEFISNPNDDIVNFCDAVCVNWYPAISWVRYPELPGPQMYKDAFSITDWTQKALRFGKPVIVSEIGIMPFNECLQNAGATGRGVTTHTNTKVPEWYFKAFLSSDTLDVISEAWTWYNEFESPEADMLWKKYNKVVY